MFWIYALVFFSLSLTVLNQESVNNKNFGPYQAIWHSFEMCKGPKQADCGKVHLENTQDMSDVIFVLDFPKECPVTKARVTIGSKQANNSTKKLWNYALDSPCQHFVLGPILMESFNLSNSCKVNKGHYKVHIDMNATSRTFLGTRFFYGTYMFKTFAYNKVNNFFCVHSIMEISKKSLN